ncbi:MAG: MotA/TolQ/ExbB proton channel family protein [Bacillota bacterium]
MNRFDMMSLIGIVAGFGMVLIAILINSTLAVFVSLPGVLVTVGGSFAALLIHFNSEQVFNVLKTSRNIFKRNEIDYQGIIDIYAELARKARRQGLLGLEDDIERLEDPFYQKGIRLMVDALDPDLIKDILETDINYTRERHELGQKVFKAWGTLAPSFGMIGTLIGLIQMLTKLDDPSALGPAMALALLTTFYGALLANMLFIPMAGKLELKSEEEVLARYLMLEGVIGIQSGMNPRILEEKLKAFVGPRLEQKNHLIREQEKEAVVS